MAPGTTITTSPRAKLSADANAQLSRLLLKLGWEVETCTSVKTRSTTSRTERCAQSFPANSPDELAPLLSGVLYASPHDRIASLVYLSVATSCSKHQPDRNAPLSERWICREIIPLWFRLCEFINEESQLFLPKLEDRNLSSKTSLAAAWIEQTTTYALYLSSLCGGLTSTAQEVGFPDTTVPAAESSLPALPRPADSCLRPSRDQPAIPQRAWQPAQANYSECELNMTQELCDPDSGIPGLLPHATDQLYSADCTELLDGSPAFDHLPTGGVQEELNWDGGDNCTVTTSPESPLDHTVGQSTLTPDTLNTLNFDIDQFSSDIFDYDYGFEPSPKNAHGSAHVSPVAPGSVCAQSSLVSPATGSASTARVTPVEGDATVRFTFIHWSPSDALVPSRVPLNGDRGTNKRKTRADELGGSPHKKRHNAG